MDERDNTKASENMNESLALKLEREERERITEREKREKERKNEKKEREKKTKE
jgi:hypothetical protein